MARKKKAERKTGSKSPEKSGRGKLEQFIPDAENIELAERYRHVFLQAPVGILRTDAEGRIEEINPVLVSLFDLQSTDQARKLNVLEHPVMRASGLSGYVADCLQTGTGRISEGSCVTESGDEIYIRFYLSPIERKGEPVGVQAMVVDLTGVRYTENRLLRLYDYFSNIVSSISPLVTVDADFRVQFRNSAFCNQLIGRDVREGENLFDVLNLNPKEEEQLRVDINASHDRRIENHEVKRGNRLIGYSIFRFADEVGLILKDITRIKRLEQRVRSLHTRLLSAQEDERQRISGELHDGIGQIILAAKLNLNTYQKVPQNQQDRFDTALDLIDRASQELRELHTMLYPSVLRDLGLESAIEWCARNVLEVHDIDVQMKVALKKKLAPDYETQIFRIVQEIFTNIAKHAAANRVRLELTVDEHNNILLRIEDQGVGFQLDEIRLRGGGQGLENIERRIA
ncbi:MAG: PAS domain S-box protein, partial [Leptospiraceae bacterium]|nr:PAS domain S-box protein [Leptospiraceae bacterium]